MAHQLIRNGHVAIPPRGLSEQEPLVPHGQLEELAELVADRVDSRRLPGLVDAATAAALLGVPTSWVLAEARRNRIPHIHLGKYVRFEPDRLTAWWKSKERSL